MSEKGGRQLRIVNPRAEGEKLLSLPPSEASKIFRSYSIEEQLAIIESTPHPGDREELFYLLPDCSELVQRSKIEVVLQVVDWLLGTGFACGMLSAVSPEQLEEMIDMTVWTEDGNFNQEMINLWLFELINLEVSDFERLLPGLNVEMIAEILRGRVKVSDQYRGDDFKWVAIEDGEIIPEALEFDDEQAKLLVTMIWAASEEFFIELMRTLFLQREEDELTRQQRIERVKEERDERMAERDRQRGLTITEEEMFIEVDLDHLPLKE